jgi:Kef-type K+ transport system membrane component KefB
VTGAPAAVGFPDDVFAEIALILLVSALAGALATRLRQPLVVAFVVVGVVVGPSVLGLVRPGGELALLAEIGVALLLFVVGLRLDLHVVRTFGVVALVVGAVQVAVVAAGGAALSLALGLPPEAALYVGIGVALSSTIIVVKLLSDRRELEDLHGRLAVGILIVQDLIVVVVLIVVATIGEQSGSTAVAFLGVALQSALFLGALAVLVRFVLDPLLRALASSPDLLLLFATAWAVSLAAIGEGVGIGSEVGAFLAGFSLASTPYRDAIGSRLVTIRDFLLLFFFIELGSRLEPGEAVDQLALALVLSAFVVLGKPLVITALLGQFRYRSRVSLETGLALAQISEFSLILAALGLQLGHIDEETATLMTVVALLTIAVSSYLLVDSETISRRLAPRLAFLERGHPAGPEEGEGGEPADVVVLGLGRYGEGVVSGLRETHLRVLGVDFDPAALARVAEQGVATLYADAEDPGLPALLDVSERGWIVSTIRRREATLALLAALRLHGFTGRIAVAAHRQDDVEELEEAGADRVVMPYASAAKEVVELVTSS